MEYLGSVLEGYGDISVYVRIEDVHGITHLATVRSDGMLCGYDRKHLAESPVSMAAPSDPVIVGRSGVCASCLGVVQQGRMQIRVGQARLIGRTFDGERYEGEMTPGTARDLRAPASVIIEGVECDGVFWPWPYGEVECTSTSWFPMPVLTPSFGVTT